MDELYGGARTAEELERKAMAEWVTNLVKEGAEKSQKKMEEVTKLNQSIQITILELGAIRAKLRELELGWGKLTARVTYADKVELSVTLGDTAFVEMYRTLDGLPLQPYSDNAAVRVPISNKVEILVSAESLKREDMSSKHQPVKSLTDDLPF